MYWSTLDTKLHADNESEEELWASSQAGEGTSLLL